MCTYTTHVRVCNRCRVEDTVLISEKLCPTARASGIFGSCLDGVLCLRDTTAQQCWQCRDDGAVVAGASTSSRSSSGSGKMKRLGGGRVKVGAKGRRSVSVGVGVQEQGAGWI